MKKTAQKIRTSTQKFIEIENIIENIVLLSTGNACLVIEVKATNFALLSKEEQDAKVLSYSSLLNSLSFPVQIVIRSKKVDVSSYLKLLDEKIMATQNQLLQNQIMLYKDFIKELVKVNTVLDKNFYLVIAHSSLDAGLGQSKENFFKISKAKLSTKADAIHAQLKRMNLSAKTLGNAELVKLFYEIYNGDNERINQVVENAQFPIVKKGL